MIYKNYNVADLLEKGGSRCEILICASSLYIVGNTQLADSIWHSKQTKH